MEKISTELKPKKKRKTMNIFFTPSEENQLKKYTGWFRIKCEKRKGNSKGPE